MINMPKPKLNKLTEQVINQIAAGEVIERPSSVVKELIDNAVDAQASKIEIKIKNGGLDLIEVSDNGIGIPSENISLIFDSHTTSKIRDIEDLNTLLSMGFRGEALSTITSVSEVILTSKYEQEEFGSEIKFDEKGKSEVKKTAKEKGSTVRVENIF
jgi:DNA mismatch repair protein MutL